MQRSCTRVAFVALALTLTSALAAQPQRGQTPQPETKTETPAVAGKWSLSLQTPHGHMTMALEMKLEAKKVTGWLSSEQFGRLPLTGEFAEAKLTFAVSSDNGTLTFVGKFKDADTLVGDLSSHSGDMPCTATRVKADR